MRKLIAVVLALICVLSCAITGSAAVVLSEQNLSVDGKLVFCEKYNIDGSNYFKLRDMAALLNGTGVQFDVTWDAETQTVVITTGVPYKAIGGELSLAGGDKSSLAVESSQLLQIDGRFIGGVSAYNIGGNNYFKLRDLGAALGFSVGYEESSKTAMVQSVKTETKANWHKERETTETTVLDSPAGITEIIYIYDGENRLQEQITTTTNGSVSSKEAYFFQYDEKGNLARRSWSVVSGTEKRTEETEYSYNSHGEITKMVSLYGDGTKLTTERLFNDKGLLQAERATDERGNTEIYQYLYNGMGDMVTLLYENQYGMIERTEYVYTYDAKGNVLKKTSLDYFDTVLWTAEFTYDSDGNLLTSNTTDKNGETESRKYYYDAQGNIRMETWQSRTFGTGSILHYYDVYGNEICVVEDNCDTRGVRTKTVTTIAWTEFLS